MKGSAHLNKAWIELKWTVHSFEATLFKRIQTSDSAPALVMRNDCLRYSFTLWKRIFTMQQTPICSFSIIVHQADTSVHEDDIKNQMWFLWLCLSALSCWAIPHMDMHIKHHGRAITYSPQRVSVVQSNGGRCLGAFLADPAGSAHSTSGSTWHRWSCAQTLKLLVSSPPVMYTLVLVTCSNNTRAQASKGCSSRQSTAAAEVSWTNNISSWIEIW